jgi:hypothetical protein
MLSGTLIAVLVKLLVVPGTKGLQVAASSQDSSPCPCLPAGNNLTPLVDVLFGSPTMIRELHPTSASLDAEMGLLGLVVQIQAMENLSPISTATTGQVAEEGHFLLKGSCHPRRTPGG